MDYAVPVLAPPSGSATIVGWRELVVGQLGLVGLEMALCLLDRGELGDLFGFYSDDTEPGELDERRRAPETRKIPRPCRRPRHVAERLRCNYSMCPLMVRNRS